MSDNRRGCILLLALMAGILPIVGFWLWHRETERFDDARLTEVYTCALRGRDACELNEEPNRVPSYFAFAFAGLSALGAVIVYGTAPTIDRA